ncbi:transketolase [Acutalibacter muris]|jgi:transketolase|uniref:transketolase n=1 Tax=Acutalibacter muris TaxID=1796620 RepID=UPI0026F3836B|nr:transketolase [Acutalibacter muris]
MDAEKRQSLALTAAKVRAGIIEGVYNAKSGHPGGSLSSADIFTYLYFEKLNIDPQDPKCPKRDRFVLSKGHCAPGLYAALALRGYFSPDELKKLRHIGAMLQGHPDMKGTPGVDMSTGSLGQGISAAVGMALAAKMDGKDYKVYCLLGDGEIQEGQVWEAIMFAAHHKLDNLCLILDYNGLQIDGDVEKVAGLEPIDEKLRSFGCEVAVADGHDFESLESAFNAARECSCKPFAIIARTTKGKGVSFMENQAGWHGKAPNAEQYQKAMDELNSAIAALA